MIEQAVIFAAEHHAGQKRKLDAEPYIYHPLEVLIILRGITEDEEVLAAGVLHDVVEDTSVQPEELRAVFGDRVAELVGYETENKRRSQSEAATWKIRKQETIDHIGQVPKEAKLITLADKLSNLRSMRQAQLRMGDGIFTHFHNNNKADHYWYYKSLYEKLAEFSELKEYREYRELMEAIFGGDASCSV